MNNVSTLIEFEQQRYANNIIPPAGSNSFYNIGSGKINLYTLRDNPANYRFDLYTEQGSLYTGFGAFNINGDIVNNNKPYRNLIVIQNTKLSVNQGLVIDNGKFDLYGELELMMNSRLIVNNNSIVNFYSNSELTINNYSAIVVDNSSQLIIYGKINTHISGVRFIVDHPNITLDSSAVLEVSGIDIPNREFSLTDYYLELYHSVINVYTQGSKNYNNNRIGYVWKAGSVQNNSHVLDLYLYSGNIILGDFKLLAFGMPANIKENLKILHDIIINKNATLYIQSDYNNSQYFYPELYIGSMINNMETPAKCIVNGKIICDGENSLITIDRGGTLHITNTGEVHLRNKSIMRSTYQENNISLIIDGNLIIDSTEQLVGFESNNIKFGPKGKLTILNPDSGERKVLLNIPNGLYDSQLYQLFSNRLNHLEYHFSNNTGIKIDQYFDYYPRDLVHWYGNTRLENAVFLKKVIWDDNAFIILDKGIIPWINENSTLLDIIKIFKNFGENEFERLQNIVDRFIYAGMGNVLFIFKHGESEHEILLNLKTSKMISIINNTIIGKYILTTDSDSNLYVRAGVNNPIAKNIINSHSRIISTENKIAEFNL